MAAPPDSLLTVRTALVLLIAVVIDLVAGILGYVANRDIASGVLIGGGAAGGAVALFHALLAR
ncbi:MAG: hypothetical protein Q8K72_08240 [Acidimicrobiales bacterium]|nr:hypothetical protein [Acidimicrobiales bacterium]